jgi:hypothetical protein
MHFIVIWTFRPENRQAVVDRFVETGGQPPVGVAMLSRVHDVSGSRGFALCSADDATAIAKWCRQWADLLTFEVVPVIDDGQLADILQNG